MVASIHISIALAWAPFKLCCGSSHSCSLKDEKKEIIKELTATWLQQQNERNKWYRSRRCFLCQLRFCQDVAFLVLQETFSWNALDSFPDLLSWVPVFTIPVAGIYIIAISLWEYGRVLFMPWASSSYTFWLRSCSTFLLGKSYLISHYDSKKERWCLFFRNNRLCFFRVL